MTWNSVVVIIIIISSKLLRRLGVCAYSENARRHGEFFSFLFAISIVTFLFVPKFMFRIGIFLLSLNFIQRYILLEVL